MCPAERHNVSVTSLYISYPPYTLCYTSCMERETPPKSVNVNVRMPAALVEQIDSRRSEDVSRGDVIRRMCREWIVAKEKQEAKR